MNLGKILLVFVGLVISVSTLSVHAADPYAPIQPFLNRYCVDCHGEKKQKGEVRLDDFTAIEPGLWIDIYEQVHHRDMPPEDETQPSDKEVTNITKLIDQISWDDTFSIATGYRRLNRREYGNTVRDLLGLKPGVYDPASKVFNDEVDHGFDTNAEELVISNELLLEYLDSAEDSLRMALFLEKLERPVTKVTHLNPGNLNSGDRRYTTNRKKSTVMRGSGKYSLKDPAKKVAVAGSYRVMITAAGVDRNNYGKMKFPPQEGPIKMGVGTMLENPGRRSSSELKKTFDLKDEKFESYETVLWLEKGAYPWIAFLNGPGKPAAAIRAAIRRRHVDPALINPKNYLGPGVEVTRFSVEGPLNPEWPPATYKTIFQQDTIPDFENAAVRNSLIERFVTRAFRRPATKVDIEDYRKYLEQQHRKTADWHEAFIKTFAAVMASHDFLYIGWKSHYSGILTTHNCTVQMTAYPIFLKY